MPRSAFNGSADVFVRWLPLEVGCGAGGRGRHIRSRRTSAAPRDGSRGLLDQAAKAEAAFRFDVATAHLYELVRRASEGCRRIGRAAAARAVARSRRTGRRRHSAESGASGRVARGSPATGAPHWTSPRFWRDVFDSPPAARTFRRVGVASARGVDQPRRADSRALCATRRLPAGRRRRQAHVPRRARRGDLDWHLVRRIRRRHVPAGRQRDGGGQERHVSRRRQARSSSAARGAARRGRRRRSVPWPRCPAGMSIAVERDFDGLLLCKAAVSRARRGDRRGSFAASRSACRISCFVLDDNKKAVRVLDRTGRQLAAAGPTIGTVKFGEIVDIAVDDAYGVYLLDKETKRVEILALRSERRQHAQPRRARVDGDSDRRRARAQRRVGHRHCAGWQRAPRRSLGHTVPDAAMTATTLLWLLAAAAPARRPRPARRSGRRARRQGLCHRAADGHRSRRRRGSARFAGDRLHRAAKDATAERGGAPDPQPAVRAARARAHPVARQCEGRREPARVAARRPALCRRSRPARARALRCDPPQGRRGPRDRQPGARRARPRRWRGGRLHGRRAGARDARRRHLRSAAREGGLQAGGDPSHGHRGRDAAA